MEIENLLSPVHLKNWIEENRESLKPPVGNRQIWANREFMVTIVGGPNERSDFHVNEGEEFFYQLQGDIHLIVRDPKNLESPPRTIPVREGEVFLLPGGVPHSPQRPAGTLGLVIERKRLPHEQDGLMWFCKNCGTKLYEEFFHLTDIVTQLPPVFEHFYENNDRCTCRRCGTRAQKN